MSAGTASHPYSRYLAAKRTVDDRALNRPVLDELRRLLPPRPPRVLEIGAGLGTMVARLLDWQVIGDGEYTLLDVDPRLLEDSRAWLSAWAQARGLPAQTLPDGVRLGGLRVRLMEAELGGYLRTGGAGPVDLLIANAVLDVVDVPSVLPPLLALLAPDGAYWFTVTFDGDSVFQPDHPADDAVLGAYHRSMDDRVRYGRPAGERRAGRHLIGHLRTAGAPPRAAGSSDWVVLAGPDGSYPDDEAWFLECILRTIQDELAGPAAPAGLAGWLAARRHQLARGELVYLAHQLDVAGRSPG
ncbi:SAM-dependent methyltransferase [Blastococcus sp. TF02-09]|uniref:methyltransferase domain-containing protein n=1 Tax=Blastococcus sp. TF02-09 TaxID=2250576 RepID=UPI000DE80950|nr:methyltransferase domain-containing protein [Blastococcus sp. TF02-9]RBY81290.1 SAM-dependent methyltransferase [Blastococcus sp. TF02-9]